MKTKGETMKTKFTKWLKTKNMNVEIFSASVGISAAAIYSYLRGDTKTLHRSSEAAILSKYPDCPIVEVGR